MFVHHVFFWLSNAGSAEDRAQLLEGLNSLKEIEEIRQLHIGVPADTNRPVIDSSYEFSLLMLFESKEAHDAYQVHPVHQEFVQKCSSLWSKVVIYDAVEA
ncbi:Dabb family protein [Pontibacter sp. SGAir0037]|uniref:Dabb family protein n=1 Tax=Pontibacter sp. SGAir0037 TaxID=2571030 RepID=UPI0010CCB8EA|nr:Dabb family protein [Pontibacter sp. SGAir0037]QCR22123.1 transcription-repair coupling factor [Pontibacter sp. SGAir0037]